MGGSRVVGACLALALAAAPDAWAQVNTENLRKKIKVKGYSFVLDGSLTGDTGNTQGIAAGGGIGGGWGSDPHLIFGYARADYTRYADVTSVEKSFAHVRYNYELAPWLWGEVFVQAQSDTFQRLDLRNLVGVGPRFRLVHALLGDGVPVVHDGALLAPENFDVFAGTAYMFERDAIAPAPGSTGPQNQAIQIWHRWSNYVTVQWEPDDRVILATTMYVQPALNGFGDLRVLSDTLITFKVTKVLAASMAGSVRYDSEPPTGVLTTDTEIKSILSLTY
jgi:hypothetical protein